MVTDNPYADLDADYEALIGDLNTEYEGYVSGIDEQYESEMTWLQSQQDKLVQGAHELYPHSPEWVEQLLETSGGGYAVHDEMMADTQQWRDDSVAEADDWYSQQKAEIDTWHQQAKADTDEYQAILDTWNKGDIDSMNEAVGLLDQYIANHPDVDEETMVGFQQMRSEMVAAIEGYEAPAEEAPEGVPPETAPGEAVSDIPTVWDELQGNLQTATLDDALGLIDTFIEQYGDQLAPEDLATLQNQRTEIEGAITAAGELEMEWTNFQTTVSTAVEGADYATALTAIDDFIAAHPDLSEETLETLNEERTNIERVQQLTTDWQTMTTDVDAALQSNDFDTAISTIDAFIEAHPDMAEQAMTDLNQMKTDIEGMQEQAEKPLSEYTPEELNEFIDNLPDTPPTESGVATWEELLGLAAHDRPFIVSQVVGGGFYVPQETELVPYKPSELEDIHWREYLKRYPGLLTVDEKTFGHIRAVGEEIEKLAAVEPGKQGDNLQQWQEARRQIRDIYIPLLERHGLPVSQDIIDLLDRLDYECRDMTWGDIGAYGSKNMRAAGFWNPAYSPFGAALELLQMTTMGWGYILQGVSTLWPGGAPAKAPWDWVPPSYEHYEEDVPSLLRTIAEWTNPIYFMPIIPAAAGGALAGKIGAAVASIPKIGERLVAPTITAITGIEAGISAVTAPIKAGIGKVTKPVISKITQKVLDQEGAIKWLPKAEYITQHGRAAYEALPEGSLEKFAASEFEVNIALDTYIRSVTKIATSWYGKFAQRLPTRLQKIAGVVHPATLLKEPTQAMFESSIASEVAKANSLVVRRTLVGGKAMTTTLSGVKRISMDYIKVVEKDYVSLVKGTGRSSAEDVIVKKAVTAAPGYEGKLSMAIGDILDDVARGGGKYVIDDAVKPVFDAYVNVINKWRGLAKQVGIDLGEGYFPRRVIGGPRDPINEEFARVVNKKLGSLTPSEKPGGRVFETQMGGIEAGFRYLPPEQVLPLFADEITQRIVSQAIAGQLKKDLPTVTAQALFRDEVTGNSWKLAQSQRRRLNNLETTIGAPGKKWIPTEADIKLAESISPEIGARLRAEAAGLPLQEAKLGAGAYMNFDEFAVVATNRGYELRVIPAKTTWAQKGYMLELRQEGKVTHRAVSYKEMGDILRSFEPVVEMPGVTPTFAVQRATALRIKDQIANLRKEWVPQYNKARVDWAQLKKSVQRGTYEMVNIPEHPALRGVQFPREVAIELRSIIGSEQTGWFLKNASNLASVLRMSKAALDLSAPMIQGLPLIFMGPKGTAAWIEGAGRSFRAMLQPASRSRFIMEHWESAISLANHRGFLGTFEFYEAFPMIAKRLETLPGGKYAKMFLDQTFGRAEASFAAFGDTARILMWESMVPTVEARIGKRYANEMFGKSWAECTEGEAAELLGKYASVLDDELFELATSLNLMTGVLDGRALGLGATQSAVESAFIFFAPRYTRACLGLMANVLRGGLTGRMAKESLGSMMAGGMALYVGTCYALGQTPNLDPRKSNFMCIRVGNRWIGPGGTFTQALKLQAKVITMVAEGDWVNLVSLIKLEDHTPVLNRWDNPLMYFLFNKTSQLTSMTNLMLIEHADFFGDPFESVADYAQFIGEEFVPIWIESSFMELPGYGFSPAGMAGEIFGLRTPPMRPWQLRNEYRDLYANHDYGWSWINLMPSEQEALEGKYSDLAHWTGMAREDWATWDDENAATWDKWDAEKTRIYDKAMNELKLAEDEFVACLEAGNDGCGATFRDKTSDIWNSYGDQMDMLEADPQYTAIYELFAEPIDPDITRALKIAYYEYLDLIYDNPKLEDEYGNYLWEVREQIEADFIEKWGEEVYDAVQQELGYGKEYPAGYTELQKARETLRPYWDIQDNIEANYESMGYVLDSDVETQESLNAALQWLTDQGAVDYEIADSYSTEVFSLDWVDCSEEQRNQLIAEHPEIEDAYYYEQIVTGAISNPAKVTKETRDRYAMEAFGRPWSDLSNEERKYLRIQKPEIEEAEAADNRYNRIVSDTVDIRAETTEGITTVAEAIKAGQQEWREQNTEGDYYLWLYYDRKPAREEWGYEAPEWAGGEGYAPPPEIPPEEAPPPETELTIERIVGDFRTAEPEKQLELVELALDTYGPEEVRAAFSPEEIAPYEWNIRAIEIKEQWKYEFREYATLKTTEEREAFLESHPEFRDDRLRVQAVDYGVPGDYVEDYVEFRNVPTAGYANEAWLANHLDFYEDVWLGVLENEPLAKSMEYYQIRGEWLNEFAHYSDLETTAERQAYLESHPEFWDGKLRLQAMDYEMPEQYIEQYVEYQHLPSAGYTGEFWLVNHQGYYEDVWLGILENEPLSKTPEYYQIWNNWATEFGEYDELETTADREAYLATNPEFRDDRRRLIGMDLEIPDNYLEQYVEYSSIASAGYGNERWLKEHPDYYEDIWLGVLENQEINFSKVPTERWETTYNEQYKSLPLGNARKEFRCRNPWFDDEGVELGRWKVAECD